MDRFEAMDLLLRSVELGSFSAVARRQGVPVSTVSRKIGELESRLGTRLLLRTTRQLSLTDAGQAYVEAARRILEQLEAAEREAAGEYTIPKGELAVTAPLCFGRLHLLPVVTDFLAQYPEITLRMLLSDRNVHLVEDHVDMATRIGRLPDSALVATRIGSMRTVVCGSPSLIASHGEPLHPDELRDLPCVAFDTPLPFPAWQFRDPASGNPFDVPVTPRLSLTTADACVEAACAGTGFTRLLHYQAHGAIAAGALAAVLDSYEPERAPVHILHVARGAMPLKLRRFIDFATPRLRERLEVFA